MKSIFITGGTGFIGSHTCLLLLEKDYTLFILDSFVNSSKKSIERVSLILKKKGIDTNGKVYLIRGDIKNTFDIEKVFQMSLKLKNFGLLEFLIIISAFYVVGMLIWTASTRPEVEARANLVKESHKKVIFT